MRSTLLIITAMFFGLIANAQQDHERQREQMKEKMESMKIAFLTKALDLTPTEAEKFWPVYNEFQKEVEGIRGEGGMHPPKGPDKSADLDNLSDAEVEKKLNEQLAMEQKMLDIKKEYLVKFKQVFSVKKVAKLYRAEQEFKRQILEEFRKRREAH